MKKNRFSAQLVSFLLVMAFVFGCFNFVRQVNASPYREMARGQCTWDLEHVFVFPATIGGDDRKALDKALKKLVDALGAAADEVSAVTKAIDKLGPGRDVVSVVLIFKCTDEDGNIHHRRVDLDDTENFLWAAKMNLATGEAAKDRDHQRDVAIKKHRPQGSCCKAKTKNDTGRTEGPKNDVKEIKTMRPRPEGSDSLFGPGLIVEEFPTEFGKIKVNLPDDISADDTISGTVVAEPAGDNDSQREANNGELSGYVVEVENQRTNTGSWAKWLIPAAATTVAVVVLDRRGREVGRKDVRVSPQAPAMSNDTPQPGDFELPKIGQTGRNVCIRGPFHGDFNQTNVTIGGQQLKKVAESPGEIIAETPRSVIGPTEIVVRENEVMIRGDFRNIGFNLSAGNLRLNRGEKTNLTLTAHGLRGIRKPVKFRLINRSRDVVQIQGGEDQELTISQVDVDENGNYSRTLGLTGVRAGNFQISANLLDDDGLGGGLPATEPQKKQFRVAVRENQKAKKEAKKARKDAEDKREAAKKAEADAKRAKETADRAARENAPDKDDRKAESDQKKTDADNKESEAKTAEGNADTKQKEADSTQKNLDKAGDKLPTDDKEKIYNDEADRLEKEAKDARGEADRAAKQIADGDQSDETKKYREDEQQKADEKKQDAEDMRKAAKDLRPR